MRVVLLPRQFPKIAKKIRPRLVEPVPEKDLTKKSSEKSEPEMEMPRPVSVKPTTDQTMTSNTVGHLRRESLTMSHQRTG